MLWNLLHWLCSFFQWRMLKEGRRNSTAADVKCAMLLTQSKSMAAPCPNLVASSECSTQWTKAEGHLPHGGNLSHMGDLVVCIITSVRRFCTYNLKKWWGGVNTDDQLTMWKSREAIQASDICGGFLYTKAYSNPIGPVYRIPDSSLNDDIIFWGTQIWKLGGVGWGLKKTKHWENWNLCNTNLFFSSQLTLQTSNALCII